jgi:hypothetical protein
VFDIGHSDSESKTFLPQTYQKPEDATNTVYVDIAGQQDTGGELIEFVNVFVTKEIFKRSKSVKFIVPIPHAVIGEARGKQTREQIQVIQQMCKADLTLMIDAIQPVLTRVNTKTTDDEWSLEDIKETLKV